MKKIYAIMRDDEIVSTSHVEWKVIEQVDILNQCHKVDDYKVSEAFICQGVTIEEKYRQFGGLGYSVGGVRFDSLEDFLISLGFIIV